MEIIVMLLRAIRLICVLLLGGVSIFLVIRNRISIFIKILFIAFLLFMTLVGVSIFWEDGVHALSIAFNSGREVFGNTFRDFSISDAIDKVSGCHGLIMNISAGDAIVSIGNVFSNFFSSGPFEPELRLLCAVIVLAVIAVGGLIFLKGGEVKR